MADDSKTVVMPVTGMSCAACQVHVERALRDTPGVSDAQVNLLSHRARVTYDPAVAKPEQLIGAVRDAGYEASMLAEDFEHHVLDEAGNEGTLKIRAFATVFGGALAMLLSMPLMGSHGNRLDRAFMRVLPWLFQVPHIALEYTLLAMSLAGMFWAGWPIYRGAFKAALHGASNMNTLVSLGTLAAFFYSAAATVAPQLFVRHGLPPEVYYEAVLLILGFLLLGKWLEARAKHRTLDALEAFAKMQPKTARLLKDGQEVEVPLASVTSGDVLVIRPGERIPVDGVVMVGVSSVDESLITGESVPVPRKKGERLIGGSLNYDGAITYRATSVGAESVLGQMLRLMEEAQSSKAPMQQLADHISGVFVPVVLALALVTFVLWAWLDPAGGISRAFAVAVTVLVIACPCAMGLAVPAALTVAIGHGARMGILFKGGESVERLAHIDTVVLDKTGTLTIGKPQITAVYPADGWTDREVLAAAASLEQQSEHPLAHAAIMKAQAEGIQLSAVSDLRVLPGKGVTGIIDGRTVAAGNASLLQELGVNIAISPSGSLATLLHVAVDGVYRGRLEAQDVLRSGAREVIAKLHALGMKTVMLTGDNAQSANYIASAAGIEEVRAGLLPDAKLAVIRELQAGGSKVAMVGDGINDAAALAQADAGLAIGTGTDLAREAGDAILLRGEPQQIGDAIVLARQTVRVMRQNLGWALGYNVLGIPIAAGVLYPLLGILLSPVIASAAMALSSVSVLSNSLRLRSFEA
ncbi:heavy metal translocating P-type ATPase [Alloacidobacterium sp.]|uniref:heavy metal translocating P-type ATPase n=1 Tax=Alloacidobacterium sp. TaxID=2951999 RepID=UPI002D5B8B9E|nr:heavy metal translocating P-type ATPase [Alloacidobacterium sp.]HYK34649.1 heavy metal translocating P-type ATPase [Alloacidobacterium sp.]